MSDNTTVPRSATLELTERELELLEIEMRNSVESGAEDPDFLTIKRKVDAALNQLRSNPHPRLT